MKTSTLLAFDEGNPTVAYGFQSQRATSAEWPYHVMWIIWTSLDSLKWRHKSIMGLQFISNSRASSITSSGLQQ